MEKRLDRLALLVGEAKAALLAKKTVLVCGLGGVGGTCLESLARSGVGSFIIVDFDIVDETNLNRQILFTSSDVGTKKTLAAVNRLHAISATILIETFATKVEPQLLDELSTRPIDFVIDAIDSPQAKSDLIVFCLKHSLPFISSQGMANRRDPTLVRIASLDATSGDPLAKRMRTLLKKGDIDLAKVPVVYSLEKPQPAGVKLASIMNVPSAAGLAMAYYCLETLLKEPILR